MERHGTHSNELPVRYYVFANLSDIFCLLVCFAVRKKRRWVKGAPPMKGAGLSRRRGKLGTKRVVKEEKTSSKERKREGKCKM